MGLRNNDGLFSNNLIVILPSNIVHGGNRLIALVIAHAHLVIPITREKTCDLINEPKDQVFVRRHQGGSEKLTALECRGLGILILSRNVSSSAFCVIMY